MDSGGQGTLVTTIPMILRATWEPAVPVPRPSRMSLIRAAAALLLLTGCAAQAGPWAVTTASGGSCPSGGNAVLDYVPFVKVDGLTFEAAPPWQAAVPERRLEGTVAKVTCTLSDVVGDPDYRPRDGDAAFLPVGTELRKIAGYRSDFRLAAHEDGRWRIYEAADVPDAGTGEDLLDIRGKVRRVHLVEGDDEGTGILRTVDRPARVTALVDAVLAAPVNARGRGGPALR